jgi:phosphodiesterase/alkaline phosphatase D-like protein
MAFNRRRFLLSLAAAGGAVSSSRPGLASALFSPTPLQGGVQTGDWPFSTSDIRGTRSNPQEKIIGPGNVGDLKVKWTFD